MVSFSSYNKFLIYFKLCICISVCGYVHVGASEARSVTFPETRDTSNCDSPDLGAWGQAHVLCRSGTHS